MNKKRFQSIFRNVGIWAFAVLLVGAYFPASALALAITSCDTIDLTTSTACQLGADGANDSADQVNADVMFGFDDWHFAEKWEFDEGVLETNWDIGFAVGGDNQFEGTWSVDSGAWGEVGQDDHTLANLMVVLKDGVGGMPNTYVGYLIGQDVVGGNYFTPFYNDNEQDKGISHISVYKRWEDGGLPPTSAVPEPSTWMLFGTGLLLLVAHKWRRNRQEVAS